MSNASSLAPFPNVLRRCPVDPTIFPPLRPDYRQPGALFANFKAFRFPSSGLVNFEVQIRFCQDRCDPVRCQGGGESFGRRRRDVSFPPLARYAFGNRTRPIFLKAHKPTIVIRPYAVRTTTSPTTTSTNEPPAMTTATQAPETTTTTEPATTTTTFTEGHVNDPNREPCGDHHREPRVHNR
ncbi:hypothetical protein MRX96_003557 [Rhipicephalus microplus]